MSPPGAAALSPKPAIPASGGVARRDEEQTGGAARRVLIISAPIHDGAVKEMLGQEAYSYYFVYRAYKPLLEKWGRVVEVRKPESQVNYAFYKAKKKGAQGYHLAFFPPHLMYLSSTGPTVGIIAWEFSTIPDTGFANNLRNNWIQIANRLQMIVTLCEFTKQTLLAAGVTAPIHVLQPPVAEEYFNIPAWMPGTITLDCPAFELSRSNVPAPDAAAAPEGFTGTTPEQTRRQQLRQYYHGGKKLYYKIVHPLMPPLFNKLALKLAHLMKNRVKGAPVLADSPSAAPLAQVKLTGIIYTALLSTFDRRKNWTDILTAFLAAFAERPEVTLVIKLVAPAHLMEQSLQGVAAFYESLGMEHRCRVVVIGAYLTHKQLLDLTRATTFYVNASRAEGLCMPLQDFLAAGRPGIAPRHTAMLDYFDQTVGFVVNSSAEPTSWPHDPRGYLATTWQRIDWQSLHEQLLASFEMAMQRPEEYREMSANARERMVEYAGSAAVEPKMRAVLAELEKSVKQEAAV